ncbi:hypothetical protein [Mycobacterium sp. 155]|uniref:hypothetical protein n=1 Tax=Mycobacterium sp. 155 TaxID=1157943 RepID=UPI000375779E|nr:hypothetical protein [Mycobacterium sp. 155]
MSASTHPAPSDEPITPDLLAQLQAGLLDDATAARLRHRARTEPEAADMLAALDRVRRDLADLADDARSAPPVPHEVTARLTSALRAAPPPEHSLRPGVHRLRRVAAIAGGCAALAVIGVGSAALMHPARPTPAATARFEQITVSRQEPAVDLSEPQLLGLLSARPDLGPLTDPDRRAQCLSALGYPPGIKVLGGRPMDAGGRRGVLILLPSDVPGSVVGLVVAPDCDAAHAGLLADTMVKHP